MKKILLIAAMLWQTASGYASQSANQCGTSYYVPTIQYVSGSTTQVASVTLSLYTPSTSTCVNYVLPYTSAGSTSKTFSNSDLLFLSLSSANGQNLYNLSIINPKTQSSVVFATQGTSSATTTKCSSLISGFFLNSSSSSSSCSSSSYIQQVFSLATYTQGAPVSAPLCPLKLKTDSKDPCVKSKTLSVP